MIKLSADLRGETDSELRASPTVFVLRGRRLGKHNRVSQSFQPQNVPSDVITSPLNF